MLYFLAKVFLTAILVAAASEVAKRNPLLGAVLASVPLVSVLAMIWLYIETSEAGHVARFSSSIFWMVLPSLSLFLVFPVLVRLGLHFSLALGLSLLVMLLLYGLMVLILQQFGTRI